MDILSKLSENKGANAKAKLGGTISAKVTRADGTVEDLGVIYDSRKKKEAK